jgi:bacillithiol biosynthesis deacetylase BshB1
MASILIVAPHPDDAELGMGGTIIKLSKQGHRVHIVDMTNGEPTPFGSPEIREKEWTAAAKVLGVERTNLQLKNREVQHSIEARHKLAAVIRKHKADWVFAPYPTDAHPDHVAVTKIAEDARFDAKLTKSDIPGEPYHPKRVIYYFCTHLRMNFTPNFCIDVTDTIEQKIQSVQCYPSQFRGPSAHVPEMVKNITAYFGSRIGTSHAEPFFTHELLGFSGLDQLV